MKNHKTTAQKHLSSESSNAKEMTAHSSSVHSICHKSQNGQEKFKAYIPKGTDKSK